MSKTKKMAKVLDKVFSRKDLINEIIAERGDNLNGIKHAMGDILKYYISSRDSKVHSYKEIRDIYINRKYNIFNQRKDENRQDALNRNIIDDGFLTHSFNGKFFKDIKKNGLGNKNNIDLKLNEDMEKLENTLGRSNYLQNQDDEGLDVYATTPGANSIHYASGIAPERLFVGPLKQEKDNALSIKMGESKSDYMMRVINNKIDKVQDVEEKEELLKISEKLINDLCKDSPKIALIPINGKKTNLNISNIGVKVNKSLPIKEYLKENTRISSSEMFFSNQLGGSSSNLDNIALVDSKIPASEIGIFSVPDEFYIKQVIAKSRGLKKGDKIDYYIGQPGREKKDEFIDDLKQDVTEIKDLKNIEIEDKDKNKQNDLIK